MTSDHYPIQLKLNSNYTYINQASPKQFSNDFNRAYWAKFKSLLSNSQHVDCSDMQQNNIEVIASKLANEITVAESRSIQTKPCKLFRQKFPRDIINTIRQRRKAKRLK